MSRAPAVLLGSCLLALCSPVSRAEGPSPDAGTAPLLASPEPTTAELPVEALAALSQRILGKGCEPKLLGDAGRRFVEAQLLCDAHLSFILVQATLDGHPLPETLQRVKALLADVLGRARNPFLRDGTTLVAGQKLPNSVLYRGYVLLMLAGLHRAGLADADATLLFDALAGQLTEALGKQPLLPSFGASVWPCDSAPAAAGLLLHGRLRGNAASQAAGGRLVAKLVELAALPSGFPTRVDTRGRPVERTPRGTTLAWTGAFLAMGSHPAAPTFTTPLIDGYCDHPVGILPLAACREWPRGVKGREDAASGPLFRGGYSLGASALAIAATRLSGQHASWHLELINAAREMGIGDTLKEPAKRPLEAALYWWGTTARAW